MKVQLFGGIDVRDGDDLRLALALLPTREDVEQAKAARDAERKASGLVIGEDGQIVLDEAAA